MPTIPTTEALGSLPNVPGARPIGGYDVSPFARGVQQIADAGARFGHEVDDIGKATFKITRQRAMTEAVNANAFIHGRLIEARERYRNDPDHATLAQRWNEEAGKIIEDGLSQISNEDLREHVRSNLAVPLARESAAIQNQAFRGAADAHASSRGKYLSNLVHHISLDPNDGLFTGGVDSLHSAIDDAVARGFVTPEQALEEKRSSALALCAAQYARMSRVDPDRAIRELESRDHGHPLLTQLSQQSKDSLVQQAREQQENNLKDAHHATIRREQESQRSSDQAENEIVANLTSEKPTLTRADISNNPQLTDAAKTYMLAIEDRAAAPDTDATTSNPTARGLLDRIRLRDGDPNKIATPDQIYDAYRRETQQGRLQFRSQGAQRLPAIKAGKRGIFVQQSGRRVYELAFSAQEMDYDDRDLTRLNLDIGKAGFVDIDKATQPDKMIFLPRSDGQAACLLYDVKDEVEAWWRLQTLGVIENVAVLPQNGIEDLVYFVVQRTVNGATRRFIERLASRGNCLGGAINQQLDSHVVYQGAPVSTITLSHLPSTTVSVWADGQAIGSAQTNPSGVLTLPDGEAHSNIVAGLAGVMISNTAASATGTLAVGTQYNGYPVEVFADIGATGDPVHVGAIVVANGAVTLPNGQTALTIIACLGYVAPFMSAKLAYATQLGTALTQRKRIDHVGLALYDANYQGIQFGQRLDTLDNLPLYEAGAATPAGTTWSEYDEPMIEAPGNWQTDARLCLLAQAPNPCTVGGVVVGLTTNEKS
jgi:hypothetical protein